jgi:hypothetical protein
MVKGANPERKLVSTPETSSKWGISAHISGSKEHGSLLVKKGAEN